MFWHSLWHSTRHSAWHSIWHSLWHVYGDLQPGPTAPAARVALCPQSRLAGRRRRRWGGGEDEGGEGGEGEEGEGTAPLVKSRDPETRLRFRMHTQWCSKTWKQWGHKNVLPIILYYYRRIQRVQCTVYNPPLDTCGNKGNTKNDAHACSGHKFDLSSVVVSLTGWSIWTRSFFWWIAGQTSAS